MARIWDWFKRRPRRSRVALAASTLAVESLEPRQMLAADAFVLVELAPAEEGAVQAAPYHAADADWQPAAPVFGQDRSPLIYLEDVAVQVGELVEFGDPGEAELVPADLPWFS